MNTHEEYVMLTPENKTLPFKNLCILLINKNKVTKLLTLKNTIDQ